MLHQCPRRFGRAFFLVACTLVTGCSNTVELPYTRKETSLPQAERTIVNVGPFTDQRKHAVHWLGAIRGGYGNSLKTLETPIPVSEVVRNAFADGLAARGLLSRKEDAPLTLFGVVEQFDCNQVARREAHARIRVTIVDNRQGEQLVSQLFARDTVTGSMITFDAGIFAAVDDLRQVAVATLNGVVDEALDSPQFRLAVRQAITPPPAAPSPAAPALIVEEPSQDPG